MITKLATATAILILAATLSPAASIKNVAVVETEVDEESGASDLISGAEVRLVTAELRREAVKNLSQRRYNVMTTETVMAQGTAVLLECAEENCVISLGSKIGADFIVRGHISRIDAKLTLAVEVYDTEDGNLVASSEAVRAEKVADLLEAAAAACAEMYKAFVNAHSQPQEAVGKKSWKSLSVGAGGVFASDFGGGQNWGSGQIGMPFYGGGAYLTFDAVYAAVTVGYVQGGGKWKGPGGAGSDTLLPDMSRSSLNIGVYAKYPNVALGQKMNLYPLLSLDYGLAVSGKLEYAGGRKYVFDDRNEDGYSAGALSALWVKAGCGADYSVGSGAYIRTEALYGARTVTAYEKDGEKKYGAKKARLGHGLTARVGAGFRL
jgi:TolB-like protein